jgi:uncharacterized RDD family membrane protein YckC
MNRALPQQTHRNAVLLAALYACTGAAVAQMLSPPARASAPDTRVAAHENRLWLVQPRPHGYAVSWRAPGGPLTQAASFYAPIALLAASGDDLYLFQTDGSFYRYSATGTTESAWIPEVNLPGQALPLSLAVVGPVPYAVVPSQIAAQLPSAAAATGTAASAPFEPDQSPQSLVCYRSRHWWAVTACPPAAAFSHQRGLPQRLACFNDKLWLFWSTDSQIVWQPYDIATGQWLAPGTLAVPGLAAFWTATVNRIPVLVVRTDDSERQAIRFYRWNANPADEQDARNWVETQLQFSPAPAQLPAFDLSDVFGFNQHLGLLYTNPTCTCLVFGRFDGPPAISTVDLLAQPARQRPATPIQTAWLGLLLLILATVFVFRRRQLVTPATLPADLSVAFTMQRLAGCLIDLLPLSLLTAAVLRIGWFDAWEQLASWAVDPRLARFGLPDQAALTWWLLTAALYAVYAVVMELATSATVGKMLVRIKVVSRNGHRPAAWQILLRNLLRLVELMPPFWVLGFLVVLSQNRQRTGDVLANTLVVRRTVRQSDTGQPPDDAASTPQDH